MCLKEYCDNLLIYGVTTQMSNYANYDAVIDQMNPRFCVQTFGNRFYAVFVTRLIKTGLRQDFNNYYV